ncbi:MAG TPA: virulence factor BrkB family protein [Candidatus Lambdaproteobacteria bacterium]|nr:virulence factor BrkB family protein [Candidatus Lambdaproteobacteria bacterium]
MIKYLSSELIIIKKYLSYLFERFKEDRIIVYSGYLSFVTLLSIVPLLAVIFSVFSLFPVFQDWRGEVESFVFKNFVPTLGEAIQGYLVRFVENATKMTSVGLVVLILVALLLISSIDHTLNHIWRVRKNRRQVVSFSIYWVVLTLGPVLIGTSLLTTSYLLSLTGFEENTLLVVRKLFLTVLPYLSSFLSFLLLYLLVPHTRVHFWSALSGAMIAAVLFELSKSAFALYFTHFPVYKDIYGALAIIPLLFVWVFISWVVILVGAQVAASLDGFLDEERTLANEDA